MSGSLVKKLLLTHCGFPYATLLFWKTENTMVAGIDNTSRNCRRCGRAPATSTRRSSACSRTLRASPASPPPPPTAPRRRPPGPQLPYDPALFRFKECCSQARAGCQNHYCCRNWNSIDGQAKSDGCTPLHVHRPLPSGGVHIESPVTKLSSGIVPTFAMTPPSPILLISSGFFRFSVIKSLSGTHLLQAGRSHFHLSSVCLPPPPYAEFSQ